MIVVSNIVCSEGQERFTWMTRVYYKEAQGCIIMFDLTSRNSFDNAVKWKKDVDSKCALEDGAPVPCMLLANKVNNSFNFLPPTNTNIALLISINSVISNKGR